ncbi:MAG: glycosyltransferase [Solirubrobacteraceae bacterium]
MRVLFITPFAPERDGIGTYSEMLTGELARQGHQVGVISARSSPDLPSPDRRSPGRRSPGRRSPDRGQIVIGALPGPGRPIAPALAATRRFAPDIVHMQFAVATYGGQLPGLLRLLASLRSDGTPIVVTLHEITRDVETLRRLGRAVYRRVVRFADRVIVHTAPAATGYRRLGAGPGAAALVAHPRCELPPAALGAGDLRHRFGLQGTRVVLSFGFIHVDKGIADLLLAVARLRNTGCFSDCRLVIAGEVRARRGIQRPFELRDRIYLRRLRRIIAEQGLADHVVFTGFVPDGEVRTWFDLATVAVLPYRRIEQSGAGSLAAGTGVPLLATDVGELAGLSTYPPVPPADPAALAAALGRALAAHDGDDSDDSDDSGHAQRASDDDLAEIAAQTAALYAATIGEPHPTGPSSDGGCAASTNPLDVVA